MNITPTANPQSPPASRIGTAPRARRPLISLTPLIDVVFILLVFFMLASSFLQWRVIDVSASGSGSPAGDNLQSVRIEIHPGELRVQDHKIRPADVAEFIRRQYGDVSQVAVALWSMPGTELQAIVTTLDHLAAGGITNVTLNATEAD